MLSIVKYIIYEDEHRGSMFMINGHVHDNINVHTEFQSDIHIFYRKLIISCNYIDKY